MNRIGRLADRMLSALVPHTTAAASALACTVVKECRLCAPTRAKLCYVQYCDGEYRSGFCNECGSC